MTMSVSTRCSDYYTLRAKRGIDAYRATRIDLTLSQVVESESGRPIMKLCHNISPVQFVQVVGSISTRSVTVDFRTDSRCVLGNAPLVAGTHLCVAFRPFFSAVEISGRQRLPKGGRGIREKAEMTPGADPTFTSG